MCSMFTSENATGQRLSKICLTRTGSQFSPIPQRHHRSLVGSATVWPSGHQQTQPWHGFLHHPSVKIQLQTKQQGGMLANLCCDKFLALEQTGNEVSYGSYNEINVLVARLHSTSGFHVSSARGCVFFLCCIFASVY